MQGKRTSKTKKPLSKADAKKMKARLLAPKKPSNSSSRGGSSGMRSNFYRKEGTISAPSLALCLELVSRIFFRHVIMADGVPSNVTRNLDWETKFNVAKYLAKKYRLVKHVSSPLTGLGHIHFSVKRLKLRCGNESTLKHNNNNDDENEQSSYHSSRYTHHQSQSSPNMTTLDRLAREREYESGGISPPSLQHVYDFLKLIFTKLHLNTESSIVSLIYAERLMEKRRLSLTVKNWRCIVVACVLTASKVWDDVSSWNIEFSNLLPLLSLASINRLEGVFLHGIEYDLYIASSEYARYYFAIRGLKRVKISAIPRYYLDLKLVPSMSSLLRSTHQSASSSSSHAQSTIGSLSHSARAVESRSSLASSPVFSQHSSVHSDQVGREEVKEGAAPDTVIDDLGPRQAQSSNLYRSIPSFEDEKYDPNHSLAAADAVSAAAASSSSSSSSSSQRDPNSAEAVALDPADEDLFMGDCYHSLIPAVADGSGDGYSIAPRVSDRAASASARRSQSMSVTPRRRKGVAIPGAVSAAAASSSYPVPFSDDSEQRPHQPSSNAHGSSDHRSSYRRRSTSALGKGGVFEQMHLEALQMKDVEIDRTIDVQIRRPITPTGLALGGRSLPFDFALRRSSDPSTAAIAPKHSISGRGTRTSVRKA